MSIRTALMASASRFAHLQPAASAARAEDDDEMKDKRADESDEDYKARKAKEKEDEDAKAAKAEEDRKEEERRARRAKRSRKAKKEDEDDEDDSSDDDEDDDDEDEEAKAAAAGMSLSLAAAFRRGARAQRARCARILAHEAAARNPALAAHLAFETKLTADAAIATMEKAAAPARPGLDQRMGRTFQVPPAQPERGRGDAIETAWAKALAPYAAKV